MLKSSVAALCCAFWFVAAAPALAQDKPIGEAPEAREAEEIFLRAQRVLLAPGQVVMDVGQLFSRADTLQLAVVDNTLQLATREFSVLTTVLIGRVGVLNETEVYAGGSFNHAETRLVANTADLASSSRNIVGGVNLGVRRTLLREGQGRPDIIASLDARVATNDDTVHVLGGGLSFVKRIDPVVLFAASSYSHGFARNLTSGTQLPRGDAFIVSFGYGLGLNESLAISTAASGVFSRSDIVERINVGRTETFSLRFALTSALARGVYIEPSIAIGLSGPGQSFTMGVTMPFSF